MTERQRKAHQILTSLYKGTFSYLGEGATSVVYTDNTKVYKVFIGEELTQISWKRGLLKYIMDNNLFLGTQFFYPIEEIISVKENQIFVYKYEQSEPCKRFFENEIIDFLIECWKIKLIFKDVKPKNFIRVNGKLKFIDYDPEPYNDNLFLNMATRAFIYCKYHDVEFTYIQKLCRSALRQSF